jgi:hypothetical protein
LSTLQVAALTSKQIVGLGTDDIAALSAAQIGALTPSAFAALTSSHIAAIDVADISGITPEQINALTCIAHRSFSVAQVQAFSTPQLNALNFATPLALDIGGDGLVTVSADKGVVFDLLATGLPRQIGWIGPTDGLLVFDRNGNGRIDDGGELFGGATRLPDGRRALDGFNALAALDANYDQHIDPLDPLFDALRVWIDSNQDGLSVSDELRALDELGIVRLELAPVSVDSNDNGNIIGLIATYLTQDGQSYLLADVWLALV